MSWLGQRGGAVSRGPLQSPDWLCGLQPQGAILSMFLSWAQEVRVCVCVCVCVWCILYVWCLCVWYVVCICEGGVCGAFVVWCVCVCVCVCGMFVVCIWVCCVCVQKICRDTLICLSSLRPSRPSFWLTLFFARQLLIW